MPVLNLAVSSASEDGFTHSVLNTWDSTALVQGFDGMFYKHLGLRYTGVDIPQGATIISATLVLKSFALGGGTGTNWGNIYGDNVDDAAAWSNSSRPDQIAKTTASIPLNYSTVDDAILNQDVSAIVQEIVNRPGWTSGNAIRFGGDAVAGAGSDGQAVMRDLNSSSYTSPLIISFAASGPGGSTGRGAALRSGLTGRKRKTARLMLPQQSEDARARSMLNWFFDRVVWRGLNSRSQVYLGTRTDGQLYQGERDLF